MSEVVILANALLCATIAAEPIPEEIDAIRHTLEHGSYEECWEIMATSPASVLRRECFIPALIRALGAEPDEHGLALLAESALAQMRDAAAPHLLRVLRDNTGRAKVRTVAARILASPSPDVIDALMESATDRDSDVRASAIHALGMLGGDKALAVIISARKDSDPEVRATVCAALADLHRGVLGSATALTELLRDHDAAVRLAATKALFGLGAAASASSEPLIVATKDPCPLVQHQAILTLACVAPDAPATVDRLISCLADDKWETQAAAAVALGWLGPRANVSIPSLCALLQRSDAHELVRLQAVESLAPIGGDSQQSLDALVAASRDANELVRTAATAALKATQSDSGPRARMDRGFPGEATGPPAK